MTATLTHLLAFLCGGGAAIIGMIVLARLLDPAAIGDGLTKDGGAE